MAAREQMGPAVLLDSDRAGLDKERKLVEMMAHGQDSVMLLGDAIRVPNAEGEDVPEFDELLVGLKKMGRTSTTIPARLPAEGNTSLLKRTFTANNWGELTHDVKARIVLHLTDLWWKGEAAPEAATLERARILFGYINERFQKLGAAEATPATLL